MCLELSSGTELTPRTSQVAQTKLVFGLISGVAVYFIACLLTIPILPLSILGLPVLMWVTLRWLEVRLLLVRRRVRWLMTCLHLQDCTSSLRAALALFRLLHLGKGQLLLLREMREGLRERVEDVAARDCGLPRDSAKYLIDRPRWRGLHAGFFSLQRRRKKGASAASARLRSDLGASTVSIIDLTWPFFPFASRLERGAQAVGH